MPNDKQDEKPTGGLRRKYIEQSVTLLVAGFGFVAALAWNEAAQALIQAYLPAQSGVLSKFIYALLLTLITVFLGAQMVKFVHKEE